MMRSVLQRDTVKQEPAQSGAMGELSFFERLLEEVVGHACLVQTNNTDLYRLAAKYRSPWRRMRLRWKEAVARLAARAGFVRVKGRRQKRMLESLSSLLRELDLGALENSYNSFTDEWSRSLIVKLLAYRILGKDRVKLPTNTGEYWRKVRYAQKELRSRGESERIPGLPERLDCFELEKAGYPIRVLTNPMGVALLFLLEQYAYERGGVTIRAQPGEVVIDSGACWGDSSLYFAHAVGAAGRVLAFEFVPDNLEAFQKNRGLNPELASRITVVEKALWSKSDERFDFSGTGPGARLGDTSHEGASVLTITIDDLVREEGLPGVDFIKLDVEGSELEVLKGAAATLRRCRPRLAVSVYHKADDLIHIPRFISELGLGYSCYLDHYTIHLEETVLYAHAAQ